MKRSIDRSMREVEGEERPRVRLQLIAFRWGILAISLTIAGAWLCQAQTEELVLTEQDDGRTVEVNVQQSISIQLRGNPSTGYSWLENSKGDSVVSAGESTYTPDPGGAVGGGGTYRFPFLASSAGTTILSFRYEQPWNPGSLARTFTVTIVVTDPFCGPQLLITIKGNNAVISWPIAGSSGFYLEGTEALRPGWAALNALPVAEGPNYVVTLPATGSGCFFRLRK